MKTLLTSSVIALVLTLVSAQARSATTTEQLEQIRAELQGLMQRVERLEQENAALRARNEALHAQGDSLDSDARGLRNVGAVDASEAAKMKGAEWASRISLKGDMRYRYEAISDDTVSPAGVRMADRYRSRIRARLNAKVQATDDVEVGIGFATAEDGDPRSSNQSLTDVFSRKSLDLDTAYIDWQFARWGHLIGGKMKQPFFKPSQSLFWDNDINPEGFALTVEHGILFGSAYGYWVNEVSGVESSVTSDTMLFGGQIGARLPLSESNFGASNLVLAAHYYDLSAAQGHAPFFAGDPNGNTTVDRGAGPVLVNDYEVVNLTAELNTTVGAWPLQIWADVARNQGAEDLDSAWMTGVVLGKAGESRSWELGVAYQVLEKDALFAQLIDSDFGAGMSDSAGWVLRAAYTPVKNWTLNGAYFLNERNRDVANEAGDTRVDYDRLQLDVNVKF